MKFLKNFSIFWMLGAIYSIWCLICDSDASIHLFLFVILFGVSPYIIIRLIIDKKIKNAVCYFIFAIIVGSLLLVNNYVAEANKMYAEYKASFHTVYFDTDGGEYIPPKEVQRSFSPSDARAKKDGYIFQGWLLDGQLIDKPIPLTHDITLKASYRDPRPTKEQLASATTIDYVTLFKGENTLRNNLYNITGEIVQDAGNNIFHVNMTQKATYYLGDYYTDRIQIEIKGKPSEILMVGDIISFTGQYTGNYTYTTVLLSDNKIPFFTVYAENLKVIGHIN